MRSIVIFCSLLMLLIGCGLNKIPYSQNTDVPKPNQSARSHYNWGLTYAEKGDLEQAITEFKLAIQKEPGWAILYYNLGAVYGNQGEVEQSILAWERATQLDADFGKAYYNLAIAYALKATEPLNDTWQVADIEKSIASLREAVRIDKKTRSMAQTEQAFDQIRHLPEYRKLIQNNEPNQ